MNRMLCRAAVLILLIGAVSPAAAYIGPGAGLSLLGALWGLIAALGAALLFVVLWPVRRMLRRRREDKQAAAQEQEAGHDSIPHDDKAPSDHASR